MARTPGTQDFAHRFNCAHEQLVELADFLNDEDAFPTITYQQIRCLSALVKLAERCKQLGANTDLATDEIAAAPALPARSRGMAEEYLTTEQMLEKLYAHLSAMGAAAVRRGEPYKDISKLPLHAIKVSLGLVPVTVFKRVSPPDATPGSGG